MVVVMRKLLPFAAVVAVDEYDGHDDADACALVLVRIGVSVAC